MIKQQAEYIISLKEDSRNIEKSAKQYDFIEDQIASAKEAFKARFVSDVLYSQGSIYRPDSSQSNNFDDMRFREAAFAQDPDY